MIPISGLDNTSETVRTFTGTTDTVTANDYDIAYTNSGAKTVSLFAASAVQPGHSYTFINENTGTVTITPASGTIMGSASYVLAAATTTAYHGITVVSDGVSNWHTKILF